MIKIGDLVFSIKYGKIFKIGAILYYSEFEKFYVNFISNNDILFFCPTEVFEKDKIDYELIKV